MGSLLAVPGIENLGTAGRQAVLKIANQLGTNPDWLVTVMAFETAHTFDPAKKNAAGSGATGLIQFMPSTALTLGTTTANLAQMSQEEQILGPVYDYFKGWTGHLNSLNDVYLAVFFPSAIGQPDDYIVGDQNGTAIQQKIYQQNSGFDWGQTGVIRRSDITRTIQSVYASAGGKRVDVPTSDFFRTVFYVGIFGVASWGLLNWGFGRRNMQRFERALYT